MKWSGPELLLSVSRPNGVQLEVFFFFFLLQYSNGVVWQARDLQVSKHVVSCWVLIFASLYALSVIYLLPVMTVQKHAYSNILKILAPKNGNFQIKKSDIFHISAQNIDCVYSLEPPRRGGSNKYPQPMFLSRNKKKNVYPCKSQFYYIKVGFEGVKII